MRVLQHAGGGPAQVGPTPLPRGTRPAGGLDLGRRSRGGRRRDRDRTRPRAAGARIGPGRAVRPAVVHGRDAARIPRRHHSPAEFDEWPLDRQSKWWVDAATRARADLLITGAAHYHRQILTEGNEKFWPNHFFFLLGGPFTYFTNDRDYYYDAGIQLAIHDMGALRSGKASLTGGGSRLQQLRTTEDETALDFIDRVGDDYGYYAASIIIPSGWLAKDTEEVKEELQEAIVQQLAITLGDEIRSRGDALLRAAQLVDFFVRPEEIEVLDGPRGLEMHGSVYLQLGRGTDRMDSWRAWPSSGPPVEAVFGEGLPAADPPLGHALPALPVRRPAVPALGP